ncbi:ORF6N domain-containing protein [Thomasclavelia cocleata]|uniref:ORF6N domain-containing protein n=1 Tax=Thomasclavelia cocleata TaxID=69824 RepID=UPI00351856AD
MNQLQIIEHQNQRVLTTKQLSDVYETSVENINKNFQRNRERFDERRDYHIVKGEELKQLKNNPTISPLVGKTETVNIKMNFKNQRDRFVEGRDYFCLKGNEVRNLIIDNEPWFVGKDVAMILGYVKTTDAVRKHVYEEDRGISKIEIPSGTQEMTIINESGLYSLIFAFFYL